VGFLSGLFASKPKFEDRVWMTKNLKLEDMVRRTSGGVNLIVYHFTETGERLVARFDESRRDYQHLRRPGTDALERLEGVRVLDSDELPDEIKRGQGRRSRNSGDTPCHVHLAEHYPIPSRDDHVLNLHTILAPGSEFSCYVGLDEAWLEKVLGDSTRSLLDQLGMNESEPLNHSMIGAALRRAQEQLDKKRRNLESYARSSSEWMQLNISE